MAHKTGAQRHVHKYIWLPSQIWACALGNCTHYLPRNMEQLIDGRLSICWQCEREMQFGDEQIRMGRKGQKPICNDCILKNANINPELGDAIEQLITTSNPNNSITKIIDPLE